MMSASYFQGGDFVELLSAQGKAPASTWRMQGKIIKSFDKNIKGNAYQMEGSAETKMQLPKTPTSSSLGLSQRFVVFQILIPFTRAFSLEIGYADFDKSRRRLVFASAFRETTTTALHAQIPLGTKVPRDQWINLVVDMQALTELYIPGSSFRSMESVCISGSCRLKRIFTMKDAPRSDALVSMLNMQTAGKKTSKTTPVAAYTDMKDIPRQFIFSVGACNLPIPTEYFLPDVVPSIEEVPAKSSSRGSKAVATARGKAAKDGLAEKKPLARVPSNMRRDRENDVAPPSASERNQERDGIPLSGRRQIHSATVTKAPESPVPVYDSPPRRSAREEKDDVRTEREYARPRTAREEKLRIDDLVSETRRSRQSARGIPIDDDEDNESPQQVEDSEGEDQNYDDSQALGLSTSPKSIRLARDASPVEIRQARQSNSSMKRTPPSIAGTNRSSRQQEVMEVIRSRLDQLTKDTEEEEERDRQVFLKHVSLSHDFDDGSTHDEDEASPIITAWAFKTKEDMSESAVERQTELLRSPEPMVLRRVHADKKPELAFSSSIFRFERGDPRHSEELKQTRESTSGSLKKLFDWDALLETLPPTQKSTARSSTRLSCEMKQSTGSLKPADSSTAVSKSSNIARVSISAGSTRSSPVSSVKSTMCDKADRSPIDQENSDDDDELEQLLAMKKRARQSREDHAQVPLDPPEPSPQMTGDADDDIRVDTESHEHNTIDDALEGESEGNLAKSDDFSSSPVPIRHISDTKQSTLSDPEPSVPKPGAEHANEEENEEDDEDLSLDLTDELEEPGTDETGDPDQDALVSPTEGGDDQDDDVPADDEDEQSFNFDDLVAQEAVTVTGEEDQELDSTSQQVLRASVESKRGENQSRDISHPTSSHRSPHFPTERRSHEPRMSQTSSERRLASLLESTDWSQLPLASLVKPSSKEDRPKTSKSHRDSVNATISSPDRASTPSTSIELVYDPILRCYYDPIGKKYYTLAK